MRVLIAVPILIGLVPVLLVGQAASRGDPPRVILTVCDVLSRPLEYDGRLVSVQGRTEGTDEGAWLVAKECPGLLVTEGHTWPNEIYLAMPSLQYPLRLHSVDFEFDFDSDRRVNTKYRQLLAHAPSTCVAFTYTGLFETRKDWSQAKLTYPDGTWKLAGFGHAGEAPGQLLLKSADDVVVIPNCKAERRKRKP